MKAFSLFVLILALSIVPNQLSAQLPVGVATPYYQTVCTNVGISNIVLTTSNGLDAGTTYAWTRVNTVNVTGLANSGTGNISGTPINTTTEIPPA